MAVFTFSIGRQGSANAFALIYDGVLQFRLFANDYTPNVNTEGTDFVEPEAAWYGPVPFVFTTDGRDANDRYFRNLSPVVWTPNGLSPPVVVYGWWVSTDDLSQCLWAERFAAPKTMFVAGDAITLLPKYLVGDLAPP